MKINLKTEQMVEKPACEIVVGDRAKLGGQWHRVSFIHHSVPPTDDDVEQAFLVLVLVSAHSHRDSELEFYECARDLAQMLGHRQRAPEPYVEIKGGSKTSLWEKRYAPTHPVKVIVQRDKPVTVEQGIRQAAGLAPEAVEDESEDEKIERARRVSSYS